jgi:hypothetical protein
MLIGHPVTQDKPSVQDQLIRALMRPPGPRPWEGQLDAATMLAVKNAYFLMDQAPRNSAETFILQTLTRLLQQLNRTSERRTVEQETRLRGRVDWQGTLKARYSGNSSPGRYVCREAWRRYDTPENQLLKYVIALLTDCLELIPTAIRVGVCYYAPSGVGVSGKRASSSTLERLRRMDGVLNEARHHIRLREITLPRSVDSFHLLRAEQASLEEYAEVARIYRRYLTMVRAPSWVSVREAGRRVVLLPGDAEGDGGHWIEVAAAMLRGDDL